MYGLSVFLMFSCRVVSKRSVRSYSSGSTKKLLEFLADMPKATSTRIAESQRQRQQIAKKFEKYTPSTVYLQVLGSGARGAPNTLYLFTDQKRYLFNCGECTQRLAHEHKVKLSRLDHIFITSKTWRNIGGLPGLSLTLQDVGVPNITLHGPEGLDELYAATKRFVIMKDMQVTMANCSPCEDFSDNVMTVKYVLLSPNENILPTTSDQSAKKQKPDSNSNKEYEEFGHDETDYYRPEQRNLESSTCLGKQGKERGKAKANGLEKDAVKKKTEKYLHELQQKSKCSIAYICTLKKRPGTLDLTKCVERGVKPGPLLGMLKNGQDVVLPDGTIVLSKDVKSPDDPGPVFIVLDVPELTYLKESEFSSHFDNGENPAENIPTVIVHFTPPHVFHHPTYRAFMAAFGPSPRHLILNAQNSCLGSEAVHRTQQKLHLLDPDIFPLLRDVSVPAVWNAQPPMPKTNSPLRLKGLEELKNKIALAQFQNIINLEGSAKGDGHPLAVPEGDSVSKMELIAGRTLTMFHLRPKKQLDRSAEPKLHIQDYIQETMDVDGFVGSLEQFRRLVDSMRYVRNESKEFPKVVFLGTGSCIPSKTRNTSAIVLQIDENHSMLLDCGEGTFGQLVRFYGPKKVNAFLRTLNAIYISHLHADHHIGLIGVIQARREAMLELEGAEPPAPLYLLAPGQIVTWLTLYHTQFEKLKSDYTLIPNQNLVHDHQQQEGVSSAVLAAIGVQSITTCFVAHCPNAFGVAIQVDNDRYKMTYSGDTLPCEELVKIGENSTLLIHEATMEDELADEARMKMHSTTTQAIDIGRQMNAKYTVLTHFSQRYARLPRLNAHILNNNNSVGIAFDNMQITMSDLELLPHMYAPLQLMFAEHCVELEMKAAQRQRHREQHAVPPSTPGNLESIHSLNLNQLAAPNGSVNLVPAKRPRYRESNASRLRQELKGMKVSGYVRIPRSMSSKSNSASESGWPMSKRTTPMNLTPPNTSRQPSMERTVGRSRKAKRKEVFQREKSPESLPHSKGNFLMKDFALKSYRNTSSDPMCLDRPCRTANGIMDFINQSRPRSSHTSCRPESSIGRINSFELSYTPRRMNLPLDTQGTSACNNVESGYGKPLMTQLSKRLTIRKDHPWSCDNGREKMTTAFGNSARSPNRSNKAQKRESISPNASVQRTKLFSTKIPTKVTESGNRLRESNTSPNVLPDTKIPMARTNLGVKSLEPSSSSLHGTRRNSRSPLRQPKSQETSGDKANATNYRWSTEQRENGPLEIINKFPDEKRKASKDVHQVAEKLNLSSKKEPSATPLTRPATPLTEPASPLTRPASPMTRPALSLTRPVSPLTRPASPVTTPASSLTRPASPLTRPASTLTKQNPSVYSNRSFKPHLEDIKSSYLLVNKISQDSAKTVAKAEKYLHNEASHVVNQFNEDRRRHMLIECKKKVQSPTFRANSRFEKIEGLNWIPWKQTKVKL